MALLLFTAFLLLHLTGGSESPGSPGHNGLPGRGRRDVPDHLGVPQSSINALQDEIRNLQARMALIEKATRFRMFTNFGKKYYVSDGHLKNYDEGIGWCREIGGKLVMPGSEEENEVLTKVVQNAGHVHAFIGATDREKEGLWHTTENLPLPISKWAPGEPNNLGKEDCVVLGNDGVWYDTPCYKQYLIICDLAQ